MRGRVLISTAVAAVGLAGISSGVVYAADMPVKAPVYKAPPVVEAYGWTGFYVGINGGWARSTRDTVDFSPASADAVALFAPFASVPASLGTSAKGGLAGGQIGYNWQGASNLVYGVELDLDWARVAGSGSILLDAPGFVPFTTTAEQKLSALGTLRGRVGLGFDRALLYVTAGFAYGRAELSTSVIGLNPGCGPAGLCVIQSTSKWLTGWTAGGGIELALAPNFSFKAEYLYYDLGELSHTAFDPGFPIDLIRSSAEFKGSVVRAGLNVGFGGPVVANY